MLRSKKDVDKHVSDLFNKQKNELERSLKGYNIARLYFEVKSLDMAQRHLASFLSVKDEHAAGHKLMGQISEATGNLERALQCYKRSLDIDANQKDLILKICELYCQWPVDPDTARYWADRAEKLFSHNKIVFKLRECIVSADGEPDLKELEKLISSELSARPRDVTLYIKLLKLYMDTERIDQAFNYSLKVEEKKIFSHSIDWYFCLSDICEVYQEEVGPQIKLEFCVHYATVLDHLITLLLAEPHFLPSSGLSENSASNHSRGVADAASVLLTFDQFLLSTSQLPLTREGPFKYVYHHMHGQLYLHLACLLLKRAKKDQGNWKEACRYSAALLLISYTFKSDNLYQEMWFNKIENKKPYQLIYQLGVLRLSYAGHVLNSLCKDEKAKFLQKMKMETCIPQVRDKIFQRAFSYMGKQGTSRSFFLQDSAFLESSLEFPSAGSLQEYDRVAQKVYPETLHHLVWLTIHRKMENKTKPPPKFQVFEKLQYSSDVLNNGAPETICQLDTDAFLIAAVFTTENALEKRKNMLQRSDDAILYFPPLIGDPLCTEEQSNWWKTAYALYSNSSKEKMNEMRQISRRGLEVIRGVGNHGLDVSLVIHIARSFADQASLIRKRLGENDQNEEVVALEERAVHYWTLALSLLKKVVSNRRLQQPKERLFAVGGKEPSTQEIEELRQEGRFYLACHHMTVGCLELAAEEFSKLSLPYASYNQAKVLKLLTAQSDDNSKKIAILVKAKEALYLTMDRISGDKKHILNLTLQEEIEALEMELVELQKDTTFDSEDRTDDEEPSIINGSSPSRINVSNGAYEVFSTPRNSPLKNSTSLNLSEPSIRHIRPSPERLDSQVRALAFTQENIIKTLVELRTSSAEHHNIVLESNNTVLESNKAILNELKEMKTNVDGLKGNVTELKKQFDEFQKAKCQHCNRSRGPHMKSTAEEDLEDEDDENGYEDHLYDYSHVEVDNGYSYNAYGHGVLHGPQRGSSMAYNYQPPQPGPPPMMLHYPHHQYPGGAPMGQPPMGPLDMSQARARNYYPHFPPTPGLPFSEGQQLPQFNFRMPPPNQAILPPATQPIAPPNRQVFNRIPDVPPVNEAQPPSFGTPEIKKEPGPTSEPQSTWNQSNSATNAPHAFQIPLPTSGVSTQPPAILSTPTFVASPFSSSQTQSSQSSPLRNALSSVPNTGMFGSPGSLGLQSTPVSKTPKKQDSSYEQASGNESEEETGGYFKPLIPLPAEVDVHTGEENEQVLFEDRAKLFRYTEKEWKERGVGLIKLLLNDALNRVRLVMRRDQVLKICANHYIKANMELKPMKDNEKAWVWIAEDFADEEVKPEQFCIRFKTTEIAKAFKVCFDDAKKRDDGSCNLDNEKIKEESPPIPVSEKTVAKESESPKTGFGDKFKPPSGSWSCEDCYLTNMAERTSCIACEKVKPGSVKTEVKAPTNTGFKVPAATATTKQGFGDKFKPPSGSWSCEDCYLANTAERTSCIACEKVKPGSVKTEVKAPTNTGFKVPTPAATTKQGFGDKFKPASGSWNCEACYLCNLSDKLICAACELPKPGAPKTEAPNPTAMKFGFKPATTQPTTPNAFGGIDLTNSSSGFIKPTAQAAKPMEFKFGIPIVSKSSSSEVSSTTKETKVEIKNDTSGTKAVLGGFTFTATPKVITEELKKDVKSEVVKDATKNEPKNSSPFAGFQFTPPKLGSGQPTGAFGTSATFNSSLPTNTQTSQSNTFGTTITSTFGGPAMFNSILPTNTPTSQSNTFGTTLPSTFGSPASFNSLLPQNPPTLGFANLASSTESPKVGPDSAFSLVTSKTSAFTPAPESPNTSKEVPEEFEPSVDFAPVVPLPELVEVKTGEESEEALFNERAKLFRFDPATKEWKERGIGNMKILKNKDTGKFRVLMRREQVLKLCANHYILPEMTLLPMNNSNKAWSWFAQDFSEGEVQTEHLAIRFKTKDLALCFQAVFKKCTEESMAELQSVENTPVPTDLSSKPLSEVFKTKEGLWECNTCCVMNESNVDICICCSSTKDPAKTTSTQNQIGAPKFSFVFPEKGFECSACYKKNTEDISNCKFCGCPKPLKPDETEKPAPSNTSFKFGIPASNSNNQIFGQKEYTFGNIKSTPTNNFVFGGVASAENNENSSKNVIEANSEQNADATDSKTSSIEFRFGSPQKFEFNFTGPRARSPTKTPKSPGTPNDSANYGTEDEGEVSSDADNIFFQPVIPLPPKIDVKTGEEDENAVFNQRAKLYRFDSGEWKERGTGEMKILRNEKENKSRLLMRRDQVLKVCLNHWLSKDIQLQRKTEKTWIWAATDFSDGEPKLEKFAVRFKSPEIAEQFETVVEKYKYNSMVSQPEVIVNKAVKCLDFGDADSTTTPSKENVPKPLPSVSTPPATFSFKLNSSTAKPGAFGLASRFGVATTPKELDVSSFGSSANVSDSKFVLSDISVVEEKKATPEEKERAEQLKLPANFYLYEKKEPCKGCRGCEECEKEVEVIFQREPTEEQLSKAALLKLPPSFFLYDEKPDCPGCRGCSDCEENVKIPLEKAPPELIKSDVPREGSETTSIITHPGNLIKTTADVIPAGLFSNKPILNEDSSVNSDSLFGSFSTAGAFSFEALASQKTDGFAPLKTSKANIFKGAGTQLFAGKIATVRGTGHDDEVAPSPDIHFEPLVPLPKLVDVVTGEEEEVAVFNERAKLFRYDKSTSQWKERGVGQFKILKHNVKSQYRLLLRREQVHKLACNHYITAIMELNPMTNSETSLCWTAMDFTEGTLVSEFFAIKFKTRDLLLQFQKKFEQCHKDVCENPPQDVANQSSGKEEPSEYIVEDPEDEGETTTGDDTVETQPTDTSQYQDEEEEEDDDVMFEKRVTLLECFNNTHEYKPIGMGCLQIRYDDSVFGARIQMTTDQQEKLCNNFIALQTCLRVKDCEAFWTAIDMSVEPFKRRQFKAIFSSKNAVEEFEKVFEEGKTMAVESEIVKRMIL